MRASSELDEAIKYYDHQLAGLGFRFFEEVDVAIKRISFMPEAWPKVGKIKRSCLIEVFPYAPFYIIESDEILVTAVALLHRNPEDYSDRIR